MNRSVNIDKSTEKSTEKVQSNKSINYEFNYGHSQLVTIINQYFLVIQEHRHQIENDKEEIPFAMVKELRIEICSVDQI